MARPMTSALKRSRTASACVISCQILHLLGLNHRDLMLERHGLKERLTDQFPARPVSEILA